MTGEPFGHVTFRKQVSDGNYGTEAAEVSIMLNDPDEDGVTQEQIAALLEIARRLVHDELKKSPAWRVRDAVTPSELPAETTAAAPDDPEDPPY